MRDRAFLGGASGKECACQCRRCKRRGFSPWVGKIPWSRKWQPTPVFLPEKFHGQRSLAGYTPQGHKESDMTEMIQHALIQCPWFFYRQSLNKQLCLLPRLLPLHVLDNSKLGTVSYTLPKEMTSTQFKLFPVQVVYCDILLHVFTTQVFIKSIGCFRCSLRSWDHKD